MIAFPKHSFQYLSWMILFLPRTSNSSNFSRLFDTFLNISNYNEYNYHLYLLQVFSSLSRSQYYSSFWDTYFCYFLLGWRYPLTSFLFFVYDSQMRFVTFNWIRRLNFNITNNLIFSLPDDRFWFILLHTSVSSFEQFQVAHRSYPFMSTFISLLG